METPNNSLLSRVFSTLRKPFMNGAFALFMLMTLLLWNGLMLTLSLAPSGDGTLGEFSSDFKRWCLGGSADTGSIDYVYLIPFITAPIVLGLATLAVYYRQLIAAARKPLTVFVCAFAAALCVGLASAGIYWTSDAVPPIAQFQDPDTPLAFPADTLRIAHDPPEIDLTNQEGARVSLDKFRGKVVILTGVYSNCPNT